MKSYKKKTLAEMNPREVTRFVRSALRFYNKAMRDVAEYQRDQKNLKISS